MFIILKQREGGPPTNIGEKIKELRLSCGLTQQELADRTELSKGYISQLESDQTSPSITTLIDLLEALGTKLSDFFNDDENEQVVFHRENAFEKTDPENGNSILWLVSNAQKNSMEPIFLTIAPQGKTYEDNPHNGEEFGYVLRGKPTLCLGSEQYPLSPGDSFYFEAGKPHSIRNTGSEPCELIWVSSPPMF